MSALFLRRISLVCILGIMSIYSDAVFAFSTITLKNPTLMEQYSEDTQMFEALYEKTKQHLPNHVFSSPQLKRLQVLEKNLTRQMMKLSNAKTPYQKRRGELQYKKARDTLTSYVSSLPVSSIRTKNIRPIKEGTSVTSDASMTEVTSLSSESLPDTWMPDSQADLLYYADTFEGGITSNGDIFSQNTYSAANCTTNLNQLIQVKHGENAVIVKVNDRPNCEKHPSIVDLSKQAFSHLADLRAGKLAGEFRRLGTAPKNYVKSLFTETTFEKLGIRLDSDIPNTYLPNDTFHVTGTIIGGGTESLIYLVTPSGKIISFGAESPISGRFSYSLPLFEIGKYDFVIAEGRSFQSARPVSFYVLDPRIFLQASRFSHTREIPKIEAFSVHRFEATDLSPFHIVSVEAASNKIFTELKISTKNQSWSRTGIQNLAFDPLEFKDIKPGESANVSFTTSRSSTPFSMDRITKEKSGLTDTYQLGPNYAKTKEMNYVSNQTGSNYTLTLRGDAKHPIHATAYIMTPSGKVDAIKFHTALPGESTLSRTSGAVLQYQMKEEGVYLVEVNYTNGFPAIIEPIIFGKTLALLPNAYDLQEKTIESNMAYARVQILDDINTIRKEAGLNPVSFDKNMQRISDMKAQDMASNKYVGHQDSQGMYALGLAESLGIEISGSIGENVAGGTVGARYLQAGLSLSPGHRLNMLGEKWKKVGISIQVNGDRVYIAQIFGE